MSELQLESGTYRIRITDKYPQNAELVVQVSGDEYEEFFVQTSHEFTLTSNSSLSTYMNGDGSGNSYINWVVEVPRPEEDVDIYSQLAIVPAAISSELDNHGEERIHIAPYVEEPELQPQGPSCTPADFTNWDAGVYLSSPVPTLYEGESVYIDYPISQWGVYSEADLVISLDNILGDIPAGSYPEVALVTVGGYMGCLDLIVRYPEG